MKKKKQEPLYNSEDYKKCQTLPPKLPIPYNQQSLQTLTLQIQKVSYVNTSIPLLSSSQLSLRTYWWGQSHPYTHLLKHIPVIQKSSQQQQSSLQYIQDLSYYQSIMFLITCPRQNFIQYCMDMKVLKMEFIINHNKTVMANFFLNFGLFGANWQGQNVALNLPIFRTTQSLNKNKIVGQLKLRVQINQIRNPYRIVPQKMLNNQLIQNRSQTQFQQQQFHQSQNSNQLHYQRQKQTFYVNKRSSIIRKQLYNNQRQNLNVQQSMIRDQKDFIKQNKQKQSGQMGQYPQQNNFIFNAQQNKYNNISKPAQKTSCYKFQRQLLHLQYDFAHTFPQSSHHQTLQFTIKISSLDQQSIVFQTLEVKVPVGNDINKYNQYKFMKQEGRVKVQFQINQMQQKQMQTFLITSKVDIQLTYHKIKMNNQNKSKSNIMNNNKKKDYNHKLVAKGSINLMKLLTNCQKQIKVNLYEQDQQRKWLICMVKPISPQQKQHKKKFQLNEHKRQYKQKEIKKEAQPKAQLKSEPMHKFLFLKPLKLIPISPQHYTNSNIFLKVIFSNNLTIQTKTIWKAFYQNKPYVIFTNDIVTLPINNGKESLLVEVWDRQTKMFAIAKGIIIFQQQQMHQQQVNGRREIQLTNTKGQVVGFLQLWIQKGDISYINSLLSIHQKQSSHNLCKPQTYQPILPNQVNLASHYPQPSNLTSIQQQTEQNLNISSNLSQSQSSSLTVINNNDNKSKIDDQVMKVFYGWEGFGVLEVHNRLFHLMIRNKQRIQHMEQQYSDQYGQIVSFHTFVQFIVKSIPLNQHANKTVKQNIKYIVNVLQSECPQWLTTLSSLYQSQSSLIKLTSFLTSYESFLTSYTQIIQQKDIVFDRFLNLLTQINININQLEDLINDKVRNQKITQINGIRKFIANIVRKQAKGDRLRESQAKTVVERFFYYFQHSIPVQTYQFNKDKNKAHHLVSLICDHLRKYQVYQTCFQSIIGNQIFVSFICSSIRQILSITYYIPTFQLIQLIHQNEIQISQWQKLVLQTQIIIQKQKSLKKFKRNHSTDKIIVKSPTFGLLDIRNNNLHKQSDRLFQNMQLGDNPSIDMRFGAYLDKNLNIIGNLSQLQQEQQIKLLKKGVQLISPINKPRNYIPSIVPPQQSNLFPSNRSITPSNLINPPILILSNITQLIKSIQIQNIIFSLNQSSLLNDISRGESKEQGKEKVKDCFRLRLDGVQLNEQYQVGLGFFNQDLIHQQTTYFVQCKHDQWEGIVDHSSNYLGCLKICDEKDIDFSINSG